jgi:hypothetical protein
MVVLLHAMLTFFLFSMRKCISSGAYKVRLMLNKKCDFKLNFKKLIIWNGIFIKLKFEDIKNLCFQIVGKRVFFFFEKHNFKG